MRRPLRIGVASLMQETNTWSLLPCTMDDFRCQDLAVGDEVQARYAGTATEIGGALRAVVAAGHVAVPLVRAWANSSGRLTSQTLAELTFLLTGELARHELDGLVLSLHGAMAAEGVDDADLVLVQAARAALTQGAPIAVCFDLHANVTSELVRAADLLTGYHTYPHTDLAETGARAAQLLMGRLLGELNPVTASAKRPMIVPAESMSTDGGPLGRLRREADQVTSENSRVLDISLFPVQPWLDVEQLGFAATVTTDGEPQLAEQLAEDFAGRAWALREEFRVDLLSPVEAIERARRSPVRPFLISESADAPTAGGSGDSAAMLAALLEHAHDLSSCITVTDPQAVAACWSAGVGQSLELSVGGALDPRFATPVSARVRVALTDDTPVLLTGPSYTGTLVSMGRYAVVRSGAVSILLTERPAFTLDPATYRHAGLDPQHTDIVVVRSANGFRAAFPLPSSAAAVMLDLPGPSTPRLDRLEFVRAPRPLFPVDPATWSAPSRGEAVLQDG